MLVHETVSFLEMTSPDDLRPGRPSPQPIKPRLAGIDDALLLRATFIQIGDNVGKGFQTRRIPPWTRDEWIERLSESGVNCWLMYVGAEVAGFLEVQGHSKSEVEIVVFGLVPEFIGKGFGAGALSEAVHIAWNTPSLDGEPPQRIWLHTSTRDHPAALPNYEARGFRCFRTEERDKDVQLRWESSDVSD